MWTTEKLGSSLPSFMLEYVSQLSEEYPASRGENHPRCTSVQSFKVSTALLYRVVHLGNLLRSPISIGSKIKTYRPNGNRMVRSLSK